jgi:magnesium transporter
VTSLLQIYKTINDNLEIIEKIEDGVWINLVNPTELEIKRVCDETGAEAEFIRAALDDEERARTEHENGQNLILVDVPVVDRDETINLYVTIPLGIIMLKDIIITVCLRENSVIRAFEKNKVKSFYTNFKTRFVFQLLYRNAAQYLSYLKNIDKVSSRIEKDLHKSMKNKELIQLLKLQKSLVFFSTSLKSNETVLEKLLKHEEIKKYPDDTDLLEDVIIENKQAIEMANIYSSILTGTMDAFASVISNNVNIVMKLLASITIIMAIPTMVASFFGMNVILPFNLENNPYAFSIVFGIAIILSLISAFILYKRKMF